MIGRIMASHRAGTAHCLEENNLPSNFQIILELPIAKEDAKRRKLPPDICKLIVRCNEARLQSKERQLKALAELLFSWRKPDQMLIAQPINLFKSLKKTKDMLVEQGLQCQLISNFSMSIICSSQTEVLFLLEHIEAEAAVFFFASNPDCVHVVECRIIKNVARDNQYERPYLANVNECSGFVFYADSHKSFEILGLSKFIMDCFRSIVPNCDEK
ncbi:MAG: hypothetical protein ACREC8_07460 [Limisphaerales bacterium]